VLGVLGVLGVLVLLRIVVNDGGDCSQADSPRPDLERASHVSVNLGGP
jgi:hypothetical protein